jgi:AsmA protein
MRANHARELVFDGPVTLRLWPHLAMTAQGVRLSEAGRPQQDFATIEETALTLRLDPLLARREIEVESVVAKGVRLTYRRDRDGQSNIDDLLSRAASDGQPGTGKQILVERIDLVDARLQVADLLGDIEGSFAVRQLSLVRFGAGLPSPLHLEAQAEFKQPVLNASLVLDAGLELLPAPAPGLPPIVRLVKTGLHLRGHGFDFKDLDARLQADAIRLDYGVAADVTDSRVDLDNLQLDFSGMRLGWSVDSGRLGLAKLHLDMLSRTLEFEHLALQLKVHRQATTLDGELHWSALKVVGESLQGAALDGRLVLGGDQQLLLQLNSQAPSGVFERIMVPALHVEVDGRTGSSTVQGNAEATLMLEPQTPAATLDGLSLSLRLTDPSLPPLQLALKGRAQLSDVAGGGRAEGTINEQRFVARVDAALDRRRAFVDVDASFGTLDLDRFVTAADQGTAPSPTTAATPINLQPLQWADARLRLKVSRLLRAPYRLDQLDLQAGIDNGVLDLQRVAGRAWGGRFDANGSADAGSGQLRLRLRADDVDLRRMLSDTLGYDGLRGRGRLETDLRSRGSTVGAVRAALNGRAALALRPAAVRGIDLAQTLRGWRTAPQGGTTTVAGDVGRQTEFSQLDASFEFRDGVGHSTDLDGRSEFLRLTGEGSIDFARSQIDYRLRARVVNTAGGRAGPEMVLLNNVTVPVELRGPFGDVTWQVNWPSVTASAAVRTVPNVVRGTGEVVGGVLRGAAGAVRGSRDPATPPPPPR